MTELELLNLVKSEMGFPVLTPLQADTDIVTYCLQPAVKRFFRWWPKEHRAEYSVERNGSVPIPAGSVGILLWEFLDRMVNPPNELTINDPFLLATRVNPNWGLGIIKDYSDWALATIREENRMTTLRYNSETGQVEFYSNVPGYFAVTYAMAGTYTDVQPKHEEILIKEASILFLRKEAMIRGLATFQTGMDVRPEMLTEKADRYEEELKELKKFRSMSSYIVMWG